MYNAEPMQYVKRVKDFKEEGTIIHYHFGNGFYHIGNSFESGSSYFSRFFLAKLDP